MTNTPNHNYNTPEKGETNWHSPLNKNFEKLDVEVEIRDNEANKADYEPKEGSKYEAIDSGAVYYGNGDTWVLTDREVGELSSTSISTGEYLKAGDSTTAVVAPSVDTAFDSVQTAIDNDHKDIIIAEEITENNIKIKNWYTRIRGSGNGHFQTINDPADGNPVFYIDDQTNHVHISNLRVEGDAQSGPVIDTRVSDVYGPAGVWVVRDCLFNAGPIILLGPRNKLIEVKVNNVNETAFDPEWTSPDYETKAALMMNGATTGIMGGSYSNKNDGDEAVLFSGAAGTIGGGVTISNSGGELTGKKRDLTLIGSARLTVGPCSFESGKEYNMQWGLPGARGIKNVVFTASGMNTTDSGFAKIRCEGGRTNNVTMINPSEDIKFEVSTDTYPEVDALVISQKAVVAEGNRPLHIQHLQPSYQSVFNIGGNKDSPETQLGLKIHTDNPRFPEEGTFALADGDEWDPAGNGSGALVTYDTDGDWKPIFEYSDTL